MRFETKEGTLDVGNYGYPLVVDWNLDGLMDLLVGEIGGSVQLFRNRGTAKEPRFMGAETIVDIAPDMYPDPQFTDLDGDGRRDIVLGGREGKVYLFPNIGSDRFPRFGGHEYVSAAGRQIDVGRLSHIHIADWNCDGTVDLLVGNDDGEVRVFIGTKKPGPGISFGAEQLLKTTAPGELICKVHPVVCFADWNGDGRTDILAGGEGGDIRFYPNAGAPGKPRFDAYELIQGVQMDLAAFAQAPPEEKRYWDNPGLEFVSEYLGNASPEVADWDGDGKLDLLVGNYAGLVYVCRNVGGTTAPSLATPVALRAGGKLLRVAGYSTPRVVDWNRDGLPDLLTGDLLGRIHIYLNTGSRTKPRLGPGMRIKVGGGEFALGPRSIVEFADLNGDGRDDLLVGNRFGRAYALLNRGTASAPRFETYEALRDRGNMWEKLYGGGWAGPARSFPLKWKKGKDISELCVEATSCPRFADLDGDGQRELLISHRFGRIFVFRPSPEPEKTRQ